MSTKQVEDVVSEWTPDRVARYLDVRARQADNRHMARVLWRACELLGWDLERLNSRRQGTG